MSALSLGVGFTVLGSTAENGGARLMALVNETCAACHGPDGNSVVPDFPKLGGQQKSYLLREMQDYKEGRRQHEIMSTLMAGLSEDDLGALADYYAAQTPTPGEVSKPELLSLGKRIYLEGNTQSGVPSCDGCHEENGEGSKKFPRVAGQHAAYSLEQLNQYATGRRSNGVKVMRTIAQRLTREEAEAVAQYMASLK
ncbi:MAG: c-type cytochrome [Thiobacillaceae bacterium]